MSLLDLYPITQDYLPLGRAYNRPGTPLNAQGMVVHDTDDPGATDENEDQYFRGGYKAASAHTFIDWDSITELIPDNEVAWHAGPTADSLYLGMELCVPPTHDPDKFAEVWKRGVWYAALEFYKKGWSTGPDLWSHAGISKRYPKETDHQDPYAYFSEYGKTFSDFISDVDSMIDEMKNGGEVIKLTAVLLYTKDDFWPGSDVAAKNGNCAIFIRNDDHSIPKDAMNANPLFVVGGPATGHPGEVLLSGKDKYDTAAAVKKYLG